MATLLHGTTECRGARIMLRGPDPDFIEPGGITKAQSFSLYLQSGPFVFGRPEEYARRKAARFPAEGRPVILIVDVPESIIALAIDDVYFPLSQGLVQFDLGKGLEELRAVWSELPKHLVPLE